MWQMHRSWAPRTVAPKVGDGALSPLLVSHPAYLTTGRALHPSSASAAFALHLPLRCARFSVVRPWLLSWARSSYMTPLGAPTLRFAPPQTPKSAPNRDYAFGVRAHQKTESGLQGSPGRRSWAVWAGAMLNFALTEFSENRSMYGVERIPNQRRRSMKRLTLLGALVL